MFKKAIISLPLLLCLASPIWANGNCQAGLSKFSGAKVAFNLWMTPPGQNAVFVSGVTQINSSTLHDQHFSDRTDGVSDRLQITIDASRSTLTTLNTKWNDRRTFDLTCENGSDAVTGMSGNDGVRLALAKWSNMPALDVGLDEKQDTIDAIPQQEASPDDLARQALAVIKTLTESDPSWVSRMITRENQHNLRGMRLATYRVGVIQKLVSQQP